MYMEHGGVRGGRIVRRVAGAVVVAALVSGCSSDGSDGFGDSGDSGASEMDRAWQENYCRELGSWQRARNSATEEGAESDAVPDGDAVVSAARQLPSAAYEGAGDDGSMLDVTVMAVRGDTHAEGEAVAYCAAAGFETLTR
ncbi:hypothetical protein [Streptomyces sp. RK62]|uniref:hypothetical protein n=1 Tax=Streptomyces sp. RK62 TaxID=2824893 RepID=UPI001B359BC9|nr:hypothetical protein [Streptomyces sp. RK62]MBQ0995231.1 hypothetical protein [Streptomyces sp. RK62]